MDPRRQSRDSLSYSKLFNLARKGATDKQSASKQRNSQKTGKAMDYEMDDLQFEKPKRPKRPKKSMNETPELTPTAAPPVVSQQSQFPPRNEFSPGDCGAVVEQ